jgi:hypothetical protein
MNDFNVYSNLKTNLSKVFSNYNFHYANATLPALMTQLKSEGMLLELIDYVLNNHKLAEYCAKASYAHPNGFQKLILMECEKTGFLLRLHKWNNKTSNNDFISRPHCHMRDGWSVLMKGSLHDIRYCEADILSAEKLFKTNIYERHDAQSYIFKEAGSVNIVRLNESHFKRGDIYSLSHESIHQTKIKAGHHCITVFLQSNRIRDYSSSFTVEKRKLENQAPHYSRSGYIHALTEFKSELTNDK